MLLRPKPLPQPVCRRSQCGFSIIELAAAIFILGAMFLFALKGSASVMSSMRAFVTSRQIETFRNAIVAYEVDYKSLPGDDLAAVTRWQRPEALFNTDTRPISYAGDGKIDGFLDDPGNAAGEQYVAWRDLRLAGLIPGDSSLMGQSAQPENLFGGFYGFAQDNLGLQQVLCLTKVPGRDAQELDRLLDDGDISKGNLRGTSKWDPVNAHNHFDAPDSSPYDPDKTYIICLPYRP